MKKNKIKKRIFTFFVVYYLQRVIFMEMLSDLKIKEIKDSVDIVDIIGSYLPLTPKGKNFFGVCPFHDDHTPSMSVSKEKQIYTCFVCHETGNVFNFIMKLFLSSIKTSNNNLFVILI